jgi:hypothetical protein
MANKNFKNIEAARTTAQAHWDNVREQLADITEGEKHDAVLLEIMALREMACAYKKAATTAKLSPLSSQRRNKSFVR